DFRLVLWPFERLRRGVLRICMGGCDRGGYGDCIRESQGRLSRQTSRIAITSRNLRTGRFARRNRLHREVPRPETIDSTVPEENRHRLARQKESACRTVVGQQTMLGSERASRAV